MRVLICGDRHWGDEFPIRLILEGLDKLYGDVVLIEGEAKGADSLARDYARDHAIRVEAFPADWATHGRAAGPIRNKQMLDMGKPEIVFALHDDLTQSKGTRNMVKQALDRGIETYVIGHAAR
jgi:hypothetical protein